MAILVAAVVAFGAGAIIRSNTGSSTSTQASAAAAQSGQHAAGASSAQPPTGRSADGGPPGLGTPVAGSTLTRLKAVATAEYPGTVERAVKRPDGSYEVHVIGSGGSGEVHVLVSKAFKVTGVETRGQGGPLPGAGSGQAAPSGQAPSTSGSTTDS